MNFNFNLKSFKNKKEFIKELDFYRSIILKKIKSGDLNSALEKVRSALVLIEEHRGIFNIDKLLLEFNELLRQVRIEIAKLRMTYERRFNNLIRDYISETNELYFKKPSF